MVQSIQVYINVDDPSVLADTEAAYCDGIGLVRTEFLFQNQAELPNEQQQYDVYRQLLAWAAGPTGDDTYPGCGRR